MKSWSRKDFLKASLIGGGAALLTRAHAQTAPAVAAAGSANGDIRIAVAGIGAQGSGHVKTYFDMPGTRLVALCDADEVNLNRNVQAAAAKNIKVTAYRDYRKLLEDKDVDAVVCAPPNHWHSLMTIWALQAGKDVYVEKPLSHNVFEGRKATEAAAKYSNRIAQVGTQNRSSLDIEEAIAFVRAGKLGSIKWARGLCYKLRESIGKTTGPQPIPASVDYDLWSGPAPLTPPRRNSAAKGPIHYDWHWFWNYGGGDIANQGIHQMDVARWFLGEPGLPPSVMSIGGRFGYDDDAETPNTQIVALNYAKAPLIFEVRGLPMKPGLKAMDAFKGSRVGVIVQCEGGYVMVAETGTAVIFDNKNEKIQQFTSTGNGAHRTNFVKALKSRKQSDITAKVEDGHISAALCHIGNISHRLGGDLSNEAIKETIRSSVDTSDSFARMMDHLAANNIDPKVQPTVMGPLLKIAPGKESFVTTSKTDIGAAANKLLTREYRAPFVVPAKV